MPFILRGIIILGFLTINFWPQIRVKAVGDIMLGSYTPKKVLPPSDGKIFIDSIGQYLAGADILFGNLEGVFIKEGMKARPCSETAIKNNWCYRFGMPAKLAGTLKTLGFSAVSQDNNHNNDFLEEGRRFSAKVLVENGVTPLEKKTPKFFIVKNRKIVIIPFGTSGDSFQIYDLNEVKSVVEKFRNQSDIIIVTFHGGAEGYGAWRTPDNIEWYAGENRGNSRKFAYTAIDAGADLVVGHGPHVLRGMEIYNHKLIAYSLGNFLTYGNVSIQGQSGITCILEVLLDEDTGDFKGGRIIPARQRAPGYPVFDHSSEAIKHIKKINDLDFPKTAPKVGESGEIFIR